MPEVIRRFKPHFYSPESADATPRIAREFQKMSMAVSELLRRHPEKRGEWEAEVRSWDRPLAFRMMENIHASDLGLRRVFLDCANPWQRALEKLMKSRARIHVKKQWECLDAGDVDGAIRHAEKEARWSRWAIQMREKNLVKNAKRIRDQLLARYPELVSEPEIRIVQRMGHGHPTLHLQMKKDAPEIRTETAYDFPTSQPHRNQNLTREQTGRPAAHDAQALLQEIMAAHVFNLIQGVRREPAGKRLELAKTYARTIGLADARKIAAEVREEKAPFKEKLREHLESKGMRIPKTPEQFREAFEKHVKKPWGQRWQEPYFPGQSRLRRE